MSFSLTASSIRQAAARYGLQVVGVTDSSPALAEVPALKEWQESGYAADMGYLMRDPTSYVTPEAVLPGARTIVFFSVYYDRLPIQPVPTGYGRIARYAWGRDYHKVLPQLIEKTLLSCEGVQGNFRVFSDAVPLLERSFAKRAGIGFRGKNTLLIRPGSGSFFLLGGALLTQVVEEEGEILSPYDNNSCGSCSRCLTQCPTNAFPSPYVLDARRCISYLTIEHRGSIPLEFRDPMGDWLFGCDICQEVYPFNHRALKDGSRADLAELRTSGDESPVVSLTDILSLRTHEEVISRFAGRALMRAKREGLVRNACVVAGNKPDASLRMPLESVWRGDPSEMVREHAAWALERLGSR